MASHLHPSSRDTPACFSSPPRRDKPDPREANVATKQTQTKAAAGRSRPSRKDPKGGLTAAGRAHYKETEGANLKPGVKGPADTPEKMKRKGSFLRRHYATLRGPLTDEDGKPTRLALQARAWGEPVPKTAEAAKKLAEKGSRLLERYKKSKQKGGQ
jgi:hypothetical protein